VGARRKAIDERRWQEVGLGEFLEPSDVWMERIDEREEVVRRTGGYLEGGRFHPRQAGSSSPTAASLTVVAQNRTAAPYVEVLHSWAAVACMGRPRGPRRLGDANCRPTCRMDHAQRNRMGSTLAAGFGLDGIVQLYSTAAVLGRTAAGKATEQDRMTMIDRARRAGRVERVARAERTDSSSLRTAAAATVVATAADEMDQTAHWTIDWLAKPWRPRRRRCS
jgi:hypothetical protein